MRVTKALAALSWSVLSVSALSPPVGARHDKDTKILILGGGVTGVIAARTLHEAGHSNFVIVEARDQLGGRMKSHTFGVKGKEVTIEEGANWVQGTQTGNGPKNPILALAEKHKVKTYLSDYSSIKTYDTTGEVDYLDTYNDAVDDLGSLTIAAGARVPKHLVDTSARTGYSLVGAIPKSPHAAVSEYFNFDFEYGQTPEESSWIGASWNNNYTFNVFSEDNLFCIDQRGFKALIQEEAAEFLKPSQVLYNHTVESIDYSGSGVVVNFAGGRTLEGDLALVTFSLGVLQYGDIGFKPELPEWKQEAIYSDTMAVYTKIFLQFPENFWFDTQYALYADATRGRYPIWQNLDIPHFLPGSHILFVTVTGDYSKRIEALSDAEVQKEVMGVLRAMYPKVLIPDPEEGGFYFPRWFSDPLTRGSYSNWGPSYFNGHFDNLRATVASKVWFAGEATSFKYYGFLHGAYFEGLNAAQSMLKCVKGGSCAGNAHTTEVKNAGAYQIPSGDV